MIINDRLYGTFKITDSLILELIHSQSVQRLKNISQYGVPDEFYHLKNYSRFEHSLGVMLLLKKLGADKKEQIAGLLHDVSHTCFSHVVDWVIGSGRSEDFQDNQHDQFIKKSELGQILQKAGYSLKEIADHQNFQLLERESPNLCVDRIDYALREFPESIAKQCVEKFVVRNDNIGFSDNNSAYTFADNYLKRQMEHWGGMEAVARYRYFADALKLALEDKTIAFSDFYQKQENEITAKLKKSKNQRVQKILSLLRKRSLSNIPLGQKRFYKKFRYVDPFVFEDNKPVRLSKLNKKFKAKLEAARRENERGVRIPEV